MKYKIKCKKYTNNWVLVLVLVFTISQIFAKFAKSQKF